MEEEKKGEDRHKSKFVGVHLDDEHLDKLAEVAKRFDEVFGEKGRNRSKALRYILECYDLADLEYFPKGHRPVSETDQSGMLTVPG